MERGMEWNELVAGDSRGWSLPLATETQIYRHGFKFKFHGGEESVVVTVGAIVIQKSFRIDTRRMHACITIISVSVITANLRYRAQKCFLARIESVCSCSPSSAPVR